MQLFSAILVLVVAASIIGTFVISFWVLIKYKLKEFDDFDVTKASPKARQSFKSSTKQHA